MIPHGGGGRPTLLDTFACEGIAGEGYQRAGFRTMGVDNDPARLRYYPGQTWLGDAIAAINTVGPAYDARHASPPCQWYTRGNAGKVTDWPQLIEPTREALRRIDGPYVIENVADAAPYLINPVKLCGCMFGLATADADGTLLQLLRPRLFEVNFPLEPPTECRHSPDAIYAGVYGGSRRAKRLPGETLAQVAPRDRHEAKYVRKGGYVPRSKEVAARLLGTEREHTWRGLQECIPPAYTEWIGKAIRKVV